MIILGIILLIVGLVWVRPLAYAGALLILIGVVLAIAAHGTPTGYGYY
ncbi:hypothetical protein I5G58_gp014 [Mycobacterium phage BirdsNest]|uniref:Uncharacterized protein n=1 Tax=Mycobacterium phage BirdsNest TaxID=2686231 RepID=A0A6B9L6W8_9CAUD|nr:hypothetical protein I5G58_gp014 [Mycobacterium phage BirdsNest]QHB37316.1 hypothetical protein PBI_BIRDSNEST_14 [Mycobacterium phage BirdsNest]